MILPWCGPFGGTTVASPSPVRSRTVGPEATCQNITEGVALAAMPAIVAARVARQNETDRTGTRGADRYSPTHANSVVDTDAVAAATDGERARPAFP